MMKKIKYLVMDSLFNYEHLIRAIHGRLNHSNSLKELPGMYYFNKPKIAKRNFGKELTSQVIENIK